MFNPKTALTRQQSPYIIKRRGPRGDEDSDSETAVIAKTKHAQQQHPLSPPPSYLKPKGKQLIAHPKLQTTNLRTSSPHVVKRAHSQVTGSVRSESTSGSGGSDETPTPTTPAPPYDRAAPRSRTPVSPTATTTTFHTARDGDDDDEGTVSGHGHPNYGKPVEWTSYEYPTPPASASLPPVPQLHIPHTPRESGSFSSE
ncbi:hypothetical protein FIBSPDRAFT_276654 [Athelia psychrophila]|uniref:Uncharacterized protein n=1 Tax=Athelia psychrophila TaxID=1759441 RepID=A0A165WQX2_9AGAM|nr:hypothetical protein FIBSPDRAFT_276654 [Fibularhizoctonia sp. CBS 109695]